MEAKKNLHSSQGAGDDKWLAPWVITLITTEAMMPGNVAKASRSDDNLNDLHCH